MTKKDKYISIVFSICVLMFVYLFGEIPELATNILLLLVALLIIALSIHIYRNIRDRKLIKTVTGLKRGTRSERKLILKLLKLRIPAEAIFHDLYLQKPNGEYSQIDLVAIVDAGIIVFEVKDYSGWIFGSGNQYKWTQVLAYGNQKHRFYNPIKQNISHIIALRQKLNHLGDIPYYSVILFDGDCVIKKLDFVPYGTEVAKFKQLHHIIKDITDSQGYVKHTIRHQITPLLKEAVINGDDKEIINQHITNIRERFGNDDY